MSTPPIAVIGLGLRLPGGVDNADALYRFLDARGDGVREVPPDRYSLARWHDSDPDAPGRLYNRYAGFLDQTLTDFDPGPFGISPREAAAMDPQQRLLLETAWEAFADSGIDPPSLAGSRTGVYVGGFTLDHLSLSTTPENIALTSSFTAFGMTMTVLSARLAYTFDLRGPCFTVDTACSSSLVATHLACRSLVSDECDLAVVGGVNAIMSPPFSIVMCKGHFLAPDGRSKAFDAAANGYGRGEGAGIVVLERLDRALANGRRIHAVLRGTAINQDGRTDGMAMPSEEAQYGLSQEACRAAGIDPSTVGYVEAHGTGTRVGDPIEARALSRTYGGRGRNVRIGSIKANVGHLEAAAGVTGLIKAVLSVRERHIFPQRQFTTLNPEIPFADLGLSVPFAPESWPSGEVARAAVNSFGYGGTNAHAIVEEPPRPAAPAAARPGIPIVPISAFDLGMLRATATGLLPLAARGPRPLAAALARRPGLRFRAAAVAADSDEVTSVLSAIGEDLPHADVVSGEPIEGRLAFVYTGMGPQWDGMGRELFASDPVFRATVEEIDAAFRRVGGWSPIDELAGPEIGKRIRRNDVAQPLNFVLQAGLTRSWHARGVKPHVVIGHSVGEVAAAWATGCLDLEQAVTVSWYRSRLQQKAAGQGTMLAIGLGEQAALDLIPPGVDAHVAAVNAADAVTLAGSAQGLAAVSELATARGIFNRPVGVEVAYHSPHMDPLERGFFDHLGGIRPAAPHTPLISTVTGQFVSGAVHEARYWWLNARNPVRLLDAVRTSVADGVRLYLEVGPHPVLRPSIQSTLGTHKSAIFFSLKRQAPEERTMARALGGLWCAGAPVTLERDAAVTLPAPPWQRKRHWTESQASAARRTAPPEHPLLDRKLALPTPAWETAIGGTALAWLNDHVVEDGPILPAAATVEMALQVAQRHGDAVAKDIRFLAAARLEPGTTLTIAEEGARLRVHVCVGEGPRTEHASASLAASHRHGPIATPPARSGSPIDIKGLYDAFARRGLKYGEKFQPLRSVTAAGMQAWATVETELDTSAYLLHPALLDGAFQATLALAPKGDRPLLPIGVERARAIRPGGSRFHIWIRARHPEALLADLVLYDDAGPFAEIIGLKCARLATAEGVDPRWLYSEVWVDASGGQLPPMARYDAPRADVVEGPLELRKRLLADRAPLVVVTHGARSIAGEAVDPAQRSLWGLVRVARTEQPARSIVLVDLPTSPTGADLALLDALPAATSDELAIRDGKVLASFIDRASLEAGAPRPAEGPFELAAGHAGRLDTLHWRSTTRRAPGAGEVEVEVRAVGLNFKDLMKAMGMLARAATDGSYLGTDLGLECSGVVSRAGEGASHKVGDRVFAYVGGAFRSHVTLKSEFVGKLADSMSFEQGASLFVYVTAWHALVEAARLQRGERVLIHAATGGVGLAAVHIARSLGAEVFATAGSDAKRAFVRDLGVPHVYDSRTLDFAEGVLRDTGGRGVDVVVNTLAGPALDASLDVLAPCGRFVELGKQDITSNRGLPMLPFNRSISFLAVDLDRMAADRAGWYGRTREGLLAALDAGNLPPLPVTTFPAARVEEAYRFLAEARHIGKVVVTLEGAPVVHHRPIRADRSYLVTGGLRGFGLEVAHHLAASGARHLWLASRSGRPEDAARFQALEQTGATVHAVSCDVADRAAVDALVAKITPPLAGVFHAAAVLDDSPLADADPARFAAVIQAKAGGALNLDRATHDLDHFVLFSSVAALVGNPAQGAYAAANAALDGLAEARIARKQPGLAIAWGALGGVGMVARDASTEAHLKGLGLKTIALPRALAALDLAMKQGAGALGALDLDWERWIRTNPAASWARLDRLRVQSAGTGAALTPEQRLDAVRRAVARVLRVEAEVERPLREYGLDSIVAVELAAAIEDECGVTVSTIELLAGATAKAIAGRGDPAAAAETPAATDLRLWVLEHICVQPPYFALDDLREEADHLYATVAAGPRSASESGPVSLAEAGRHLAILGSAAVRRKLDEPGRIYFPVARSWLVASHTAPASDRYLVEARFTGYDRAAARATAEATLRGLDGTRLATFGVEYHVIPRASFETLFAAHARPTSNSGDPYSSWAPTRVAREGDTWVADHGIVSAPECQGHFDGFPAYPVSILFRAAIDVVSAAAGRPVHLIGGEARALRFAWVGERLRLIGRGSASDWTVEARVGDEEIATFAMQIAT